MSTFAASGSWAHGDGTPLKFQNGDYVAIDTTEYPAALASLPFTSGYIRGYNLSTVNGISSVAYELFKVGHNPLCYVREEFLDLAPSQFGVRHGKGAHGNGRGCALCGANP